MSNTFPFAAIVGQEDMKLAIIMSAIDPKIGGVLVFGDRGTGKSTAVRGLANLLPPINSVDGCPVNSSSLDETPTWSENTSKKIVKIPMPVVDLPLGIGADRVTGALDIEKALVEGVKSFQPGLLAKANRGYLYIDEVNLLEDHIVDLLLDVSQSGENVIEREGLSIRHASNFILIGSGNPEEGELRPQLLDRFGLSVEVLTPQTIKERIEVIKRRDLFDQGPEEFQNNWKKEDKKICSKIVADTFLSMWNLGNVSIQIVVLTLVKSPLAISCHSRLPCPAACATRSRVTGVPWGPRTNRGFRYRPATSKVTACHLVLTICFTTNDKPTAS